MNKSVQEQQEALFNQTSENSQRQTVAAIASGVLAVGTAYLAVKTGLSSELLDTTITPQPEAQPKIVDGFVIANETLREVAPAVTLGAISTGAYYYALGKMGSKGATLNKMANTEYSGVDEVIGSDKTFDGKLKERINNKTAQFRRGTGVAALAILLTGATSGVEHEIANGPQRPIDKMYELLAPGNNSLSILVQGRNNTFMDDSDIDRTKIDNLITVSQAKNIRIVPFDKKLFNIDGKSALQISVPISTFEAIAKVEIDQSCQTVPVIIDETVGKKVGQTANINGVEAQVVGVSNNIAQMNRSIAVLSDRDMKQCLQDATDTSYFGAVVPDMPEKELTNLVNSNGVSAEVIDQEHFEASNRRFWRANGTPILLQLIAYVGLFGGFAAAGERKSALQRNAREIGMLNAQGVDIKDIRRIENRRAVRETAKAAIIAAPAMPLVAGMFNMAEIGLKVGVGLRELCVGTAVTLAAKLIGGRKAAKKFGKNLDLSQAVKG